MIQEIGFSEIFSSVSPVRATSGSHATIGTPGAVEQILFKVMCVASENLKQPYHFKIQR